MANLHWAGHLGIQGVDCARVQAMVPPKLWQKMRCGQEKNAKTAEPPVNSCVAVPSENGTTKIAEFRFVAGSGGNRTIIGLEITKKKYFFVKNVSIHRI